MEGAAAVPAIVVAVVIAVTVDVAVDVYVCLRINMHFCRLVCMHEGVDNHIPLCA